MPHVLTMQGALADETVKLPKPKREPPPKNTCTFQRSGRGGKCMMKVCYVGKDHVEVDKDGNKTYPARKTGYMWIKGSICGCGSRPKCGA